MQWYCRRTKLLSLYPTCQRLFGPGSAAQYCLGEGTESLRREGNRTRKHRKTDCITPENRTQLASAQIMRKAQLHLKITARLIGLFAGVDCKGSKGTAMTGRYNRMAIQDPENTWRIQNPKRGYAIKGGPKRLKSSYFIPIWSFSILDRKKGRLWSLNHNNGNESEVCKGILCAGRSMLHHVDSIPCNTFA